ncbi:MAG: hypothetical protein CMB82_11550 [Flammeovirgaceae bacterium]|nr:hypothetical protein [Flammeovirgaceae bacterium]
MAILWIINLNNMLRLFVSLILFIPFFGYTQSDKIIWENVKPIEPDRYIEVKGSPFLFETFVESKVLTNNNLSIENVLLNYNGYTHQFEALHDGLPFILEEKYYERFEFVTQKYDRHYSNTMSDTTVFIYGLNPEARNKFYILVYENQDLTIFKDFRIEKTERAVETPGKTELFINFSPFFTYYTLINGKKVSRFKLNKKSVIGLFEESKEMNQFIKSNKLSLKSEKDLKKLLEFNSSINQ